MRKKEFSINKFNKTIQSRLNDDQWDSFIANQVLHLKHEQNKRKLQMVLIPVIVLTATTIYFSGTFTTNLSPYDRKIARQKEIRQKFNERKYQPKQTPRQFEQNNNQDYIIETVFTHFQ